MKKIKKVIKWDEKTDFQKREFIIRLVLTSIFLIGGIVTGFVSMYLSGWNFVTFITNPTTDIIILVCLIGLIFVVTYRKNRGDC